MKLNKILLGAASLLLGGHGYALASSCTNVDTLYGISGTASTAGLYIIDPVTAASTAVAAPNFKSKALTHDNTNNRLYYISSTSPKTLAYYDVASDSHSVVNSALNHGAIRLDTDATGTVYGTNGIKLFSIDTITGVYTELGKLKGFSSKAEKQKGDIAFGPSGELFMITKTSLFTINTATLWISKVSDHSISNPSGLDFDSQGTLYVSNTRSMGGVKVSNIYTLNPSDASSTLVGTTTARIDALAVHTDCVEDSTGPRPDITVMGYNIMQLPVQDWDQSQRASMLAGALLADVNDPDVISFSEVLTDEAYTAIQGLNPEYPYYTPVLGQVCSGGNWDSISGSCSNSLTVVRGGVAIASKHPILEQHAYVFNVAEFGTADYQANKGAVYVKIDIDGFNYHVLATHTQATHGDSTAAHGYRVQQVQEIRAWIDSFGIPVNEPVIIAGDLNVSHDNASNLAEIIDDGLNATLWFDNANTPGYVHSYPEDNWMARAYNYYFEESDPCYNKTLDYVVSFNDYLQPSVPAQMDVVVLKNSIPFYWSYLDGYWYEHSASQQGICATGTGFTDYYGNEGVTEGYFDGYYTDLSDHYPVIATYQYN